MNSRRTMTYAVAAATAATLALSGCNGGEDEPTSSPTGSGTASSSSSPSSSASATGSETPTPSVNPSIPAEARANTDAGAIAFGKFFVVEMDRAYVTADSGTLKGLFTGNCEDCQNLVLAVDALKADGARQQAPSVQIANATFAELEGKPAVDVFADFKAIPRVDAAGSILVQGKERKAAIRLRLVWKDRWLADEVGTL